MTINMIQKHLFLLVCLSALLLLSCCTSNKYYSDFKRGKKEVDTLTILTPYVYVEFSTDQTFLKDDEQSKILTQHIFNSSYSLLDKKYKLAGCMLPPDFISASDVSNLFSILDNSDKNSEIPIPFFIQNLIKDNSSRYFLMVVFNGYYNANYEPYYRMKSQPGYMGPQSGYGIGIRVYPNTEFYNSDMRVLVFDNQKNIIVYYDKKYSKHTDPRIIEQVEKMTLDMFRPLYYK